MDKPDNSGVQIFSFPLSAVGNDQWVLSASPPADFRMPRLNLTNRASVRTQNCRPVARSCAANRRLKSKSNRTCSSLCSWPCVSLSGSTTPSFDALVSPCLCCLCHPLQILLDQETGLVILVLSSNAAKPHAFHAHIVHAPYGTLRMRCDMSDVNCAARRVVVNTREVGLRNSGTLEGASG